MSVLTIVNRLNLGLFRYFFSIWPTGSPSKWGTGYIYGRSNTCYLFSVRRKQIFST